MLPQFKEHQKQSLVTKIKESNTFKNAPTSIALLQYLFDATTKDTDLKEAVIDIEFFGKQASLGKNTPRVRVNVFNLRKKLADYYISEGANDVWVLTIDKGQYRIRFYKKESKSLSTLTLSWSKIIPYAGLLITILIIIYTNTTPKPPKVWGKFLDNNITTNLFIGDHFGVTGKTITGDVGWTRDFNINDVNEFYDFLEKNPKLKNSLKPANYSYTTRMAALATQQFQILFQKYKKNFNIRFSTQTSISEIKEGNAIYAGPTKNNNQFIHFFNEGNPYFKITNDSLILNNHPEFSNTKYCINKANYTEEYAIVSKYSSINNTEHFVFFSQHDIGVIATTEYFTNKDSLALFKDNHLKNSEHFTAIFKVKGQDRTNTNIELTQVISF
ncbi:hypothetical protein [uncultured Algibacter sp.]|uniref:hypothetical protein n=1 Tax=uncultured Algibacter sp. TaxID=298659 RepID=UPI0026077ED8|nr:hypothetical protein [uncultured Algibacter sp.]